MKSYVCEIENWKLDILSSQPYFTVSLLISPFAITLCSNVFMSIHDLGK